MIVTWNALEPLGDNRSEIPPLAGRDFFVYTFPMKWNQWSLIILGGWSLLSPWILGFSDINLAAWNSILIGALVVLFALWNFSSKQ